MSDFRRRLMMLRKSEGGLPSGYTKLNYLESTGTQYINLGFAIKYDNIVNVDVLITKFNIQQYTNGAIFGSANELGLNAYNLLIDKENKLYYRNSANNVKISSQVIEINKKYDITTNLNNLIVNGVIYSGEFDFNYINERPALLFARNTVILSNYDFAACQIYKFNILNQIGNVIINFVPCLDKNGKPCMFDTVSKKPFYNQGTGEFLYG